MRLFFTGKLFFINFSENCKKCNSDKMDTKSYPNIYKIINFGHQKYF